MVTTGASPLFEGCTFVSNSGSQGTFLGVQEASPVFSRCIVANQPPGVLVWCLSVSGLPSDPTFTCTNLFENASGDWTWECIADQAARDGNFSADPLFCSPETDVFTLDGASPCLPDQHPEGYDCGLVGAFDRGCGAIAVTPATWGSIKSVFDRR